MFHTPVLCAVLKFSPSKHRESYSFIYFQQQATKRPHRNCNHKIKSCKNILQLQSDEHDVTAIKRLSHTRTSRNCNRDKQYNNIPQLQSSDTKHQAYIHTNKNSRPAPLNNRPKISFLFQVKSLGLDLNTNQSSISLSTLNVWLVAKSFTEGFLVQTSTTRQQQKNPFICFCCQTGCKAQTYTYNYKSLCYKVRKERKYIQR